MFVANSSTISNEILCFYYSVQELEEKDYGNYILMLNSSRGSKIFTFQVISTAAPSPPTYVSVVCNVSTANLSWTAGSAGEAPTNLLSFFVSYSQVIAVPSSRNENALNSTITLQMKDLPPNAFNILNGTELAKYSYNFHNLTSGKLYVFELNSKNAIGHLSKPPQKVKCITKSDKSNSMLFCNFYLIIIVLLMKVFSNIINA